MGTNQNLLSKVDELEDLLIQHRQITDVVQIVEKDNSIRSLNIELQKKNEIINDLKQRIVQMMENKNEYGSTLNHPFDSNK